MVRVGGVALIVLLAGCADTDPYLRTGMWQPTGANSINLAAMVANPHDLIKGRSDRGVYGNQATQPVARLWAGTPAALPGQDVQQGPSGPASPAPATGGK